VAASPTRPPRPRPCGVRCGVPPRRAGVGGEERRGPAGVARGVRHRHADACSTRPARPRCGGWCTPAAPAPTGTRPTRPGRTRTTPLMALSRTPRRSWRRVLRGGVRPRARARAVRLRFCNVFGPRSARTARTRASSPSFASMLAAGRTPTVHGTAAVARLRVRRRRGTRVDAGGRHAACQAVYNARHRALVTCWRLIAELNAILGTRAVPAHGPGAARRRAALAREHRPPSRPNWCTRRGAVRRRHAADGGVVAGRERRAGGRKPPERAARARSPTSPSTRRGEVAQLPWRPRTFRWRGRHENGRAGSPITKPRAKRGQVGRLHPEGWDSIAGATPRGRAAMVSRLKAWDTSPGMSQPFRLH
jgi:hypothetical protein